MSLRRLLLQFIASTALALTAAGSSLATQGDPDLGFGDQGWIREPFLSDPIYPIKLLPLADGKLIAVSNNNGLRFTRFTATGQIDTTYANQGIATYGTELSPRSSWMTCNVSIPYTTYREGIASFKLQSDGSILLTGFVSCEKPESGLINIYGSLYAYRLDPSGIIDTTFGNNGLAMIDLGLGTFDGIPEIADSVVLKDKRIITAVNLRHHPDTGHQMETGLVAMTEQGTLDGTFGIGGVKILSAFNHLGTSKLMQQPDGKILGFLGVNAGINFPSFRVELSGAEDLSYGSNGYAAMPLNAGVLGHAFYAATLQSTGKILISGIEMRNDSTNRWYGDSYVARLNVDGSLDTSFGVNGMSKHSNEPFRNLAVDTQDQFYGITTTFLGDYPILNVDLVLAYYSANGRADTTFGNNGVRIYDQGNTETSMNVAEVTDAYVNSERRLTIQGTNFAGNSKSGDYFLFRVLNPEATVCQNFSATNSAHVTAGRSYSKTTGTWIKTTTYYAYGSNQNLGTSGSTLVTLKEDPKGYFASGYCATAPVIDLLGTVLVNKVAEDAANITFEITASGKASDVNGDIDRVVLNADSDIICSGTTSFSCAFQTTRARSTLPATLNNVSVTAYDKAGRVSAKKTFAAITLSDFTCKDYTSANSAHVTAGRAYGKAGGSIYLPSTTYYATGSNENLGTTATTSVTLKESPQGYFIKGSCPLPPVAPVVNSYNPLVNGTTLTVTGKASDGNNDLKLIQLEGLPAPISCTGTANYTCSAPNLAYGTYTAWISATDTTGNTAQSATFTVTVKSGQLCVSTATLDQHTTAGRAYKKSNGSINLPWVTFYATGSNENLGTTPSTSKTLYANGAAYWQTKNPGNCTTGP